MRIAPWIAATALALMLAPGPASAAVECGVSPRGPEGPAGDALAITTTEASDGVALFREGERIAVSDDRRMLAVDCLGGPADVGSVDSIELVTQQLETFLYLDLSGGGLIPGVEGEGDGDPEIELGVEWPMGFLGIGGTRRADLLSFGHLDGRVVGQLNLDDDADLSASSAGTLLVRGQGGDDTISARGFTQAELPRQSEPPPTPLRTFASFEGGPGNDTLAGGTKYDFLSAGRGDDLILADGGRRDEVDCGAGDDEVFAGPRDRLRGCERVVR